MFFAPPYEKSLKYLDTDVHVYIYYTYMYTYTGRKNSVDSTFEVLFWSIKTSLCLSYCLLQKQMTCDLCFQYLVHIHISGLVADNC